MTIGPFIRDKISRDVNRTATYIRREFEYLYRSLLCSFILDADIHFVPFIRQARVLCKSWRLILSHLNDPIVQIQIQIAMNLIIMSKEFLHMRSSKSQEFWLPVTDYPRAFRSSTRGSQAQGTRLIYYKNVFVYLMVAKPIRKCRFVLLPV